jgi:phosphatidylinositol-3-phosphatase
MSMTKTMRVVAGVRARRRSVALVAMICAALAVLAPGAQSAPATAQSAPATAQSAPATARGAPTTAPSAPVRHVWVIVLENKEFSETFGPGQVFAPYLTQTLTSQGALVPNYYGTGHSSADNYIAMVGGQPPTNPSKNDCPDPLTTLPTTADANGVAQGGSGCVYPANFKTIGDQLAARHLTWKAYAQNMPAPCSLVHDAPGDYARKHNGFLFFLSVRNSGQCARNDVPLAQLPADLKQGPANVNFIFPDQCADGHSDCTGANPIPGVGAEADELSQADAFLKTWVPQITATRAFKRNGLLAVIFDEGDETLSCCGEPMTDPDGSFPGGEAGLPGGGGGQTGAVLVSPFIKPGTLSTASYNHYSLLASIEDMFRLRRLGEANLPGTTTFGSDVFTSAPPPAHVR